MDLIMAVRTLYNNSGNIQERCQCYTNRRIKRIFCTQNILQALNPSRISKLIQVMVI